MVMNLQAINSILTLSEQKRYEYTIKRIADSELVWLLDDNGWISYGDDFGNILLPIWSEQEFAELNAINEWETAKPTPMEVEEFLLVLIPMLIEQNINLAIFPLPNTEKNITIDSKVFALQLNNYIAEWYANEFELPYK